MKRLVTGTLIGTAWLLLLFLAPAPLFNMVVVVLALLMVWEYTGMTLATCPPALRLPVAGATLLPVFGAAIGGGYDLLPATLFLAFLGVTLTTLAIAGKIEPFPFLQRSALAILYIGLLSSHLILLRRLPDAANWLFLLTVVIVASDTGAFYTGTIWGRTKLCPHISPGKTVEGLLGGLCCALLAGTAVALWRLSSISPAVLIPLILIIALVGVGGDLVESIIKRGCNTKDSGQLLPGHGGLLDRIDALLLATPILYYWLLFVR